MSEFNCLPSQLDKEDNEALMNYLAIKNIITEEQRKKQEFERRKQKNTTRK